MIQLNFYKELKQCFDEAGIEGGIIEVPPELEPTLEDYKELEHRMTLKAAETDRMLAQSQINAQFSLPIL